MSKACFQHGRRVGETYMPNPSSLTPTPNPSPQGGGGTGRGCFTDERPQGGEGLAQLDR